MRYLHLTGSAVDPLLDDVSRLYAGGCLDAFRDTGEHVVAHVSPGGAWRFPGSLDARSLAAAEPLSLAEAVARLSSLDVDVALPQMFCRPGMTTYRALLDLVGIPYVGNRPDVMALGADKPRASAIVGAAGVAVPASQVVHPTDPEQVDVRLDLPVVVKPADADNSSGVTLVREASAYPEAVRCAAEHSDRVLVESFVELGREVRCGVLETPDGLVCLPLEEYAVDAGSKPIRDRADKLARDGDGTLTLVAKDAAHAWIVESSDPVNGPVQEAAMRAYEALGCRHHGLFDFRIDPQGRPHFLEASLYCSFAPTSVIAVMARAAGISLHDLLDLSVRRAVGASTPEGVPA